MFIYRSGPYILILLLYVDDIIVTGSASSLIYSFINRLSHEFAMKDLGDLHFFGCSGGAYSVVFISFLE